MLLSAPFVPLFLMFKTNFSLNRQSSAGNIPVDFCLQFCVKMFVCHFFFKFTSLIFSPEGVHNFFKDSSAYLLSEVFFNRAHTFSFKVSPGRLREEKETLPKIALNRLLLIRKVRTQCISLCCFHI